MRGPWHAALDDLTVAFHRVVRVEGRLRGEALKGEDANTPPVCGKAVTRVEDNFRSKVLGRATKRPRAPVQDLG